MGAVGAGKLKAVAGAYREQRGAAPNPVVAMDMLLPKKPAKRTTAAENMGASDAPAEAAASAAPVPKRSGTKAAAKKSTKRKA